MRAQTPPSLVSALHSCSMRSQMLISRFLICQDAGPLLPSFWSPCELKGTLLSRLRSARKERVPTFCLNKSQTLSSGHSFQMVRRLRQLSPEPIRLPGIDQSAGSLRNRQQLQKVWFQTATIFFFQQLYLLPERLKHARQVTRSQRRERLQRLRARKPRLP